jgi:hypothetical protein
MLYTRILLHRPHVVTCGMYSPYITHRVQKIRRIVELALLGLDGFRG